MGNISVTKVLGTGALSTPTSAETVTKIEGAVALGVDQTGMSVTKIMMAVVLANVYPFTVQATDADGCITTKPCQITVTSA